MPYNRDDLEWDELVQAGFRILTARAVGCEMLSYGDFVAALAGESDHPPLTLSHDRAAIGPLLAEITALGRQNHPDLMLSVLVYNKASSIPSSGFFALAKRLGLLPIGASERQEWDFMVEQTAGLDRYYTARAEAVAGKP